MIQGPARGLTWDTCPPRTPPNGRPDSIVTTDGLVCDVPGGVARPGMISGGIVHGASSTPAGQRREGLPQVTRPVALARMAWRRATRRDGHVARLGEAGTHSTRRTRAP